MILGLCTMLSGLDSTINTILNLLESYILSEEDSSTVE